MPAANACAVPLVFSGEINIKQVVFAWLPLLLRLLFHGRTRLRIFVACVCLCVGIAFSYATVNVRRHIVRVVAHIFLYSRTRTREDCVHSTIVSWCGVLYNVLYAKNGAYCVLCMSVLGECVYSLVPRMILRPKSMFGPFYRKRRVVGEFGERKGRFPYNI